MKQLRTARVDINVCEPDRRRHYGLEAIGTLKAGTNFRYAPGVWWHEVPRKMQPGHLIVNAKASGYVGREIEQAILAGSDEREPVTFAEVLQQHDMEGTGGFAADVIDKMVTQGTITMAQASQALLAVLGDEED